MPEQIALDMSRYNTPIKLSNLITDTASLSIEASDTDTPRVNEHFFIKTSTEKIIIPGHDKRDVLEMYDPLDPTTKAGKQIRELLLEEKNNCAYVWISSANKDWPETRIEIGTVQENKSKKHRYIKAYGISTKLSENESLRLGQLLVSVSNLESDFPENTDQLRGAIIKLEIPVDKGAFEYLSEIIELPEQDVFKVILNDKARKIKAEAVKAAVIATEPVRANPTAIYTNPIGYGAYVETQMKNLGHGMNPKKFGCGRSNLEVGNNTYYQNTSVPPGYTEASVSGDGLGPQKFNCPACGFENQRPIGGYVYECQNSNCTDKTAVVC